MSFEAFIVGVNYFILAYFLAINGIYLALYAISFAEIADYVRREVFSGLPELFASNYAPPVSVIVPAYNEEVTCEDSVRSLLRLDPAVPQGQVFLAPVLPPGMERLRVHNVPLWSGQHYAHMKPYYTMLASAGQKNITASMAARQHWCSRGQRSCPMRLVL